MTTVDVGVFLAALTAAVAVAAAVGTVLRPTRRLAAGVQPYAQLARSRLGRSANVSAVAAVEGPAGALGRVFGPIVSAMAAQLSLWVDACGDDELMLRLRQAGFDDIDPQQYRIRQLAWAVGGAVGGGLLGGLLPGLPRAGAVLAVGGLGLFYGAVHWRARLSKAIGARRERMRVDLYTVAQLLAIMVRTGYGPVEAMRAVVRRGRGPVIEELDAALSWMSGGMPEAEALERLAADTPEPAAARLYRLLAAGMQAGGDLAQSLRAISDDLRAERREDVDRRATGRRLRMLFATVVVMAPVVFVFLLPPLPSIVLGTR